MGRTRGVVNIFLRVRSPPGIIMEYRVSTVALALSLSPNESPVNKNDHGEIIDAQEHVLSLLGHKCSLASRVDP